MFPRLVRLYCKESLSFDGVIVGFDREIVVVVHVSSIGSCFDERSLVSMVFVVVTATVTVTVVVAVELIMIVLELFFLGCKA